MPSCRKLLAAVAGLVLIAGVAPSAQAISLHAGDVVTFNADFTGATPPPPYLTFVAMRFLFSDVTPEDLYAIEAFDGLNDTGAYLGMVSNIPVPSSGTIVGSTPPLLDGVFSLRLTAQQGDFSIDSVWAEAFNDWSGMPVATVPVAFPVPEPTSLALFGTIAGIAALRRRATS
jgi:PEP-CTERM motif-containing protein